MLIITVYYFSPNHMKGIATYLMDFRYRSKKRFIISVY